MPTIDQPNRYGALDEDRLEQFEAWLEARLPADFRTFLLESNGGRPEPAGFFIDDWLGGDPRPATIECFFALHDQVWDNETPDGHLAQPLQDVVVEWVDEQEPLSVIPVGRTEAGDLLCVGCAGADYGQVFVAERAADYALTRVADSFDAFLAALTAASPAPARDER